MPGMSHGPGGNPALAAAFRTALLHQVLAALLIVAAAGAAWVLVRARRPGLLGHWPASGQGAAWPEPRGRRLLRIGFGILWLFDGILQAQPAMAAGLPEQVTGPAAAGSPLWVQRLATWGGSFWVHHPLPAATSAVWIEAGLGAWLLAARHGRLSRLAGLASMGWGLLVWVFGEAFGELFGPGLSWLTGAPGAALVYAAAGGLIALPGRAWCSPRLGRLALAGLGLFLAGMAVLQAWPGRGSWQGSWHGQPGALAGMAQAMAVTPQPGFLSGWVSAFASFDQAHGFAVNLFTVTVLAVTGAAFLSGRPSLVRPALSAFTVLCLDVWILVQDLGFLGGLGTDPGSMIPFALLAIAGYLALTRPGAGAAGRPAGRGGQAHGRSPHAGPAWTAPGHPAAPVSSGKKAAATTSERVL